MPAGFEYTNNCFLKLFSYFSKNKEIKDVNVKYGQAWEQTDNNVINSIFKSVDNGDGIIQAEELDKLNKIAVYIDHLKKKTAGNEILETEELQKFEKLLKSRKIDLNNIPEFENKKKTKNWSEGLDRNLSTIYFSSVDASNKSTVEQEVEKIGREQGFSVKKLESGEQDFWIEDSSIIRHDGKRYVQYNQMKDDDFDILNLNGSKSTGGGARVLVEESSFYLNIPNKDKVIGTSYLEGGNVLNTLTTEGKPAAVIGDTSIDYTLKVMELDYTPENIEKAKLQIASDLGLDVSDVTFIPQYDFHIDMLYRPLHNGEIAIPDFDEAIKLLQENSIPTLENIERGQFSNKKELMISYLQEMRDSSKDIRDEAEEKLRNSGYKIVKIPCFTGKSNLTNTNYMNGVGGTSSKTGETFYITNSSVYPELNGLIEPYLKKAGIDKVYFVSTQGFLCARGGLDCITLEE